jgi:hypothetical protein
MRFLSSQPISLKAKRESILSTNRVQVQDYDDCGSNDPATIKSLARSLVLPLPRSIIEGNQWCSFLSKGVRSYAMYPSTTAFYPCTVVDSTTYCQGDNDIVVVEFDGDEGKIIHVVIILLIDCVSDCNFQQFFIRRAQRYSVEAHPFTICYIDSP